MNPDITAPDDAEAVAERLLTSALGTIETLSIHLGDRLGWYRSLVTDGPATPPDLAARTATQPRYAREWLEQQAVFGLLRLVEPSADPDRRVYGIGPAEAEVLTDPDSLSYLAPLARMLAAAGAVLPELLAAYRDGGGVTWERLGADARESQADMNRPWYLHALPAAIAACPEVDRLLRRPDARVIDVGCGVGWSTIALARAYPGASLRGLDVDAESVRAARDNAREAGVADRVRFEHVDGGSLSEESLTVAFAFECLHDMPRPVEVLASIRQALDDDGVLVVMDEAVADEFAADGDDVERLMYGFSLLVCLPDGLSTPGSVGTGTVMRRPTLERYAREAGFASVEVLPTGEFGLWRFYLLRP